MTMMNMDDAEDESAAEELELNLNQLCVTRPDLAPENLDADGLMMATNESQPSSVDEIVKEYLPQPSGTVENISSNKDEVLDTPISPLSRNEVDGTIEIATRLTLFTTDERIRFLFSESLQQNHSKKIGQNEAIFCR